MPGSAHRELPWELVIRFVPPAEVVFELKRKERVLGEVQSSMSELEPQAVSGKLDGLTREHELPGHEPLWLSFDGPSVRLAKYPWEYWIGHPVTLRRSGLSRMKRRTPGRPRVAVCLRSGWLFELSWLARRVELTVFVYGIEPVPYIKGGARVVQLDTNEGSIGPGVLANPSLRHMATQMLGQPVDLMCFVGGAAEVQGHGMLEFSKQSPNEHTRLDTSVGAKELATFLDLVGARSSVLIDDRHDKPLNQPTAWLMLVHELSSMVTGPVCFGGQRFLHPPPLSHFLLRLLGALSKPHLISKRWFGAWQLVVYGNPDDLLGAQGAEEQALSEPDVPFLKTVRPLQRVTTRGADEEDEVLLFLNDEESDEEITSDLEYANRRSLEFARRGLDTLNNTERAGAQAAIEFVEKLLGGEREG